MQPSPFELVLLLLLESPGLSSFTVKLITETCGENGSFSMKAEDEGMFRELVVVANGKMPG